MTKKPVTFVVLLVFVLASSVLIGFANASSEMWSKTYSQGVDDRACSLVVTSDGGFALAGYTGYADGDYDFWLVKTDANGNMQWNQTYGGAEEEGSVRGVDLIISSDGGFALTGYTRSFGAGDTDFWLVKTDANGNMEWNQTYGGEITDVPYSFVETSDGGFAIVGTTFSFNSSGYDFWLVKTDSEGNMLWNQTYGTSDDEEAFAIVETSDGGFAIVGNSYFHVQEHDFWLVKTDANGNMEWNQTYGGNNWEVPNAMIKSNDGGLVIAGYTTSFGAGNMDCWLVKTDESGNVQWNQTYGGPDYEQAFAVIQTSDQGYALAGQISYLNSSISNDFFFIKTDNSGNLQWGTTYGDQEHMEIAYALVETPDGNFALAGEKHKTFWLIKDDINGAIPEFGSWIVLPLLFISALGAIVVRTKLKNR